MKKTTLTAVFITAAMALNAQTKSMTDTIYSIDEVKVIALSKEKPGIAKLNMPIQYLPLSVSSVSSNLLQSRGITEMQDAVKFLPNTRMRTTYGGYQQFEVRGFDYTPIMIDGVRDERTSISNSTPLTDLSAVESIELLKGPASVLYGHSTVGGILNVVRKNPTKERIVNFLMSYGSWNNKRAMIDLGGKLVGPFNYRAVINWSDNEGYRYTNDKRFSGYFAVSGDLGKNQQLDIRGGFNRDSYGTEIGLPRLMPSNIYNSDGSEYLSKGELLPGLNKRWRYNNESDFLINNGSNLMAKYTNKISEHFKLENRLAYNYDNIDYLSTEVLAYKESTKPIYNHYYLTSDKKKQYIQLDSINQNSPLRFAYTIHVINEELEASGQFKFNNGIKYNYLAGYNFVAFYRDRYRGYQLKNVYDKDGQLTKSADLYGPGRNNTMIPSYNPVSNGTVDSKFSDAVVNRTFSHSFYLQNLIEFSEQFKVMVSGRYDHFSYWNATAGIDNGKRKYIDRTDFSKLSNSALTYRVGAVYLPTTSFSVYGSFANYFSPYRDMYSPNTVYINSDGNRFYPKDGEEIFKPQTGYQGEIGTRYTYSHFLQASASIFYIRKNNEKKTIGTAYKDPEDNNKEKTVIGQVGTSDSKGFELEVSITPTNNTMISLGYGYTDARIRKFSTGNLAQQGLIAEETQEGMRLAGIPKNTFFGAVNYSFQKGALKNLALNGTVTYTDNVFRDMSKSVVYPSYWLVDLGASYKLNKGISLRVNANNIFNKEYYNQSLGTQMVPSLPRNYLFTVSYSL